MADLQSLAVMSVGVATLSRLEVEVVRWRAPIEGWLGQPGASGIGGLQVEADGTGVAVRMEFTRSTDAAVALAAVVRMLTPTGRREGAQLTFAPGLPETAGAMAGALHDVLPAEENRDPHVRRCDLLLVPDPQAAEQVERSTTVVVGTEQWHRDGIPFDVSVDPTVHRPIGRRSTVEHVVATVESPDSSRLRIAWTGGRVDAGPAGLGAGEVSALRAVDAVLGVLPPRIERQLQACGVLVADSLQALPADDLAWQVSSVHERRHALRQYGPTAVLDAWPTVSVVLATHRPDHLVHAFAQLARLRYPRLEVVIGAHGDRVDAAAVWELAQDLPVPVTVLPIDASRTLGEALQACSERAEGELLTKMDDDDHYGAEHIWDLVLARQYSGAQIVGKTLDWIHVESHDTTAFRPVYAAEKYARFVAGGTMLISRGDLAAVGGWRPVPRSVDRALLDRVLDDGGLVYRTHGLGYVYVRRGSGHTASVRDEHFLTKTAATYPGLLAHEALGTAGATA